MVGKYQLVSYFDPDVHRQISVIGFCSLPTAKLVFTLIYATIGIEYLSGVERETLFRIFGNVLLFSTDIYHSRVWQDKPGRTFYKFYCDF